MRSTVDGSLTMNNCSLRVQGIAWYTIVALLAGIAPVAAGSDAETYAWQQNTPYVAPDFEGYFPDDRERGSRLDGLWAAADREARSDEEILTTVRAGLRHTTRHRQEILRWIGNRYIWNVEPQNAAAVELMYHAADPGEAAARYHTRHSAVYFGLSVVQPKSSAILRALADLCMRVDDPNDLDRVAWGCATQRDELLGYLQPYLDSQDALVHNKAEVVRRIVNRDLQAFVWARQVATIRAQERFADELPAIRNRLLEGSSAERLKTIDHVFREEIYWIMDDSFVPAYAAAARDPDPRVRQQVAILVGEFLIWRAETQSNSAIALELQLTQDSDRQVRYNAVYFGLSTVCDKDDLVVRRLLDMAMEDREPNLYRRICWGLLQTRDRAVGLLQDDLRGEDSRRTESAQQLLNDLKRRP